jgi:hypothetical protein
MHPARGNASFRNRENHKYSFSRNRFETHRRVNKQETRRHALPALAVSQTEQSQAEPPVVEVARPHAQRSIDATLRAIVASTGLSPVKVMRDFVGLAMGRGRLAWSDYVWLRLFDHPFWQGADRQAVVGVQRAVVTVQSINYRFDWWGVANNKIAAYSYLAAYGFPVIGPVAFYYDNLATGSPQVLSNSGQLRALLTNPENFPMFGKPVESMQSLGSIAVDCYVPERDALRTRDQRLVPVDLFIEQLKKDYPTGYVFQKLMSPHDAIKRLCGDRLATVRIVTASEDNHAKVLRACWKIPSGTNSADNYWREGNLLASLDAEGRVRRVLSGNGVDMAHHEHHPDSGMPLTGFTIPYWQRMLDTVLEAARLMQHIPLIGWDVAVLDTGPVIVEMNESPDFLLPQLADTRGVLEPDFLAFIERQRRRAALYKKDNARAFKAM